MALLVRMSPHSAGLGGIFAGTQNSCTKMGAKHNSMLIGSVMTRISNPNSMHALRRMMENASSSTNLVWILYSH